MKQNQLVQLKNHRKVLLVIIGIAVTVGGLFWYLSNRNSGSVRGEDYVVPGVVGLGEVVETEGGSKQYMSEHYGFSFQIPAEFTVGEFDEAGGRVVLVQSNAGDTSFQIFISPYDESADTLTPERIQKDLPNLVIREPEALAMTGGSNALTFIGEDSSFGETREVWMVNSGNLFQVMTYVGDQDFLAEVLNSWVFQ